ncbi:uncharacterized protein EV154DRAFT_592269, partial [Mucor mucedo]|uniref:uncharacterized protein n=1 Tax=Mucor mucedo TaxID=29922 RepID=UPI0022209918
VAIGPGYISKLHPNDNQLFVASAAVAKFKKTVALDTSQLHTKISMSQLRQVTTSFYHASTFSSWRRSFEHFSDIHCSPATIFTLCDLPSFKGYGSNSTSVTMLSSQLLAAFALIKDSKAWIPLQAVVEKLKMEFKNSTQVNVFEFAFVTSLSAVAEAAGELALYYFCTFCPKNSKQVQEVEN